MGEIDTWYIDSAIQGLKFRVDVDPDPDTNPDEFECYSDGDKVAWKRDEWQFVITTVTPEYKGTLIRECLSSMGGTEWGFLPGATVRNLDRTTFREYPLDAQLIPDVMESLRGETLESVIAAHKQAADAEVATVGELILLKEALALKA